MSAPMLRQGEDVHEWTAEDGYARRVLPRGVFEVRYSTRWTGSERVSHHITAEMIRLSAIVEAARVYEGTRDPDDFERLQRLLMEG